MTIAGRRATSAAVWEASRHAADGSGPAQTSSGRAASVMRPPAAGRPGSRSPGRRSSPATAPRLPCRAQGRRRRRRSRPARPVGRAHETRGCVRRGDDERPPGDVVEGTSELERGGLSRTATTVTSSRPRGAGGPLHRAAGAARSVEADDQLGRGWSRPARRRAGRAAPDRGPGPTARGSSRCAWRNGTPARRPGIRSSCGRASGQTRRSAASAAMTTAPTAMPAAPATRPPGRSASGRRSLTVRASMAPAANANDTGSRASIVSTRA